MGLRPGGNGFFIGIGTTGDAYNNRYTNIQASYVNEANGLYVCKPEKLVGTKRTAVQFSAKWVIEGYRYKLYIGDYKGTADELVLDIDLSLYTTKVKVANDENTAAQLEEKLKTNINKIPCYEPVQVGMTLQKVTTTAGDAKGVMYAENFTVRDDIWTGDDITLTGPAYKLITDEEGNRITSDYWYAEADFEGSAQGRSWAGILTDMMGQSAIQTADKNVKTDFYGTGYGYGQVFIHKGQYEWFNGEAHEKYPVDTTKPVKIASARMGNMVYVYINDDLRMRYMLNSDKPSQFGVYAGTGELNNATVKNFKYVVGKDATEKKMAELTSSVTKNIGGKDYKLTVADMYGSVSYSNGNQFVSFGGNWTVTGKNSAKITGCSYGYQAAHSGNIYYMEAEFPTSSGWHGIMVNTLDKWHNNKFIGFGYAFGKLYMQTTDSWSGKGEGLVDMPNPGANYRLGVARICNSYYIFVNGKFFYHKRIDAFSVDNDNVKLPYDNESGFGVFVQNDGSFNGFNNACFTMDEDTVREICANAANTGDTTEYVDYNLTEQYVISGKMDITNPVAGKNRWVGFNVNGGNNRFLLWDADANDTFEFAYSVGGSHIHNGNLPASEYVNANTTIDWKFLHDGKNAYFFVNGKLKMVYVNAILAKGNFSIEKCNVATKLYDVESAKVGSEQYAAELKAVANYQKMFANDTTASMYRVEANNAQFDLGGAYQKDFIKLYGLDGDFIYETTLVINSVAGNAHYGIHVASSDNRFLFWNTGAGNTFKITWAYDGGYDDAKYQRPATAGTYLMRMVVKGGYAYWFVDGELMCGLKAQGGLSLIIQSMDAHTEGTKMIYANANAAEYNAAIAGLNLPAITGATRF